MLVVTRKPGEEIIIRHPDGDITLQLTHVDSRRRQARIGIECPKHIEIIRAELEPRYQPKENA